MADNFGDRTSSAFIEGLSGFWQRFFKDTKDIAAFYEASEQYLGQVYLDLMASVLNVGLIDTPVFNTEVWKLFAISEQDLQYREGSSAINDRYVYDMPGTAVDALVLQNSIFNPQVLYEKNLHYDSVLDGYVRFYFDLFKRYSTDGKWYPERGVAWRTIVTAVGNAMVSSSDTLKRKITNYETLGVKIGDTLRILANAKQFIGESITGTISVSPTEILLQWSNSPGAILMSSSCTRRDLIQIYDYTGVRTAANDAFIGFYLIESVGPEDTKLYLYKTTQGAPLVASSGILLKFKVFRSVPVFPVVDCIVAKIDSDTGQIVVREDTPLTYPTDGLLTFRIVRDPADSVVEHEYLNMDNGSLVYPVVRKLAQENITLNSVKVFANKDSIDGGLVVEGVDYAVDYAYGIFYQLKPWHSASLGACTYAFKKTVTTIAAGSIQSRDVMPMKQLSLWAPSVLIDRFTLWYNYGSLINRFEASSEQYKKFLRGVFHLYISGPVFLRIESALNLILEYPLVINDGERLLTYDNGILMSGTTAAVVNVDNAVSLDTAEYTFTSADVGSTLRLLPTINAVNRGYFKIIDKVEGENIVIVSSEFPLIVENNMQWELSVYATQTLTTDVNEYLFPLTAPIKSKLLDSLAAGITPVLNAFDPLTDAFKVVDYIEDPIWWHNKEIPQFLWENSFGNRRNASSQLYENILGAADEPCMGDPGLYSGADSTGLVPEDPTLPVYRNKAAFMLFDMYLKFHMFYVEIHQDIPVTASVRDDLDELVLIAKPSYTYPYVVPGREFIDLLTLTDSFDSMDIGFNLGGIEDDYMDSIHISDNRLILGDPDFPMFMGDSFNNNLAPLIYFLPVEYIQIPGKTIPLMQGLNYLRVRLTTLDIICDYSGGPTSRALTAKVTGKPIAEGVDYSVDWCVETSPGVPNPQYGVLTILTEWTEPLPAWLPIIVTGRIVQLDNTSQYWATMPETFPGLGDSFVVVAPEYDLALGGVSLRYYGEDLVSGELVRSVVTGQPLVEGDDYVVDYVRESSPGVPNPTYGTLTVLTNWEVPVLNPTLVRVSSLIQRVEALGYCTAYTPISSGGLNPCYVRKKALNPDSPTYVEELLSRRTELLEQPICVIIQEET